MIRAVIFDMDGLLTDSEAPGLTGIQVCGRLQGYEIPLEHVRRTIGINAKAASDFYHQYYPGLDTDRLFADFTEYSRLKFAESDVVPYTPAGGHDHGCQDEDGSGRFGQEYVRAVVHPGGSAGSPCHESCLILFGFPGA